MLVAYEYEKMTTVTVNNAVMKMWEEVMFNQDYYEAWAHNSIKAIISHL